MFNKKDSAQIPRVRDQKELIQVRADLLRLSKIIAAIDMSVVEDQILDEIRAQVATQLQRVNECQFELESELMDAIQEELLKVDHVMLRIANEIKSSEENQIGTKLFNLSIRGVANLESTVLEFQEMEIELSNLAKQLDQLIRGSKILMSSMDASKGYLKERYLPPVQTREEGGPLFKKMRLMYLNGMKHSTNSSKEYN